MKSYSRAPLRISFAGGGSDVEPFCSTHGGCVVSATIARYVWVEADDSRKGYNAYPPDSSHGNIKFIEKLVGHFVPAHLNVRVDVPHRSGLGGSGAFGVATVACLNNLNDGNRMTINQIAEMAYFVESKELGFGGGRQDQYASAHGGLNFIKFDGDNIVSVQPLRIDLKTKLSLEKSLFLVYTHPRENRNVIDEEIERVKDKNKETMEALSKQKQLAIDAKDALLKGDLKTFGAVINESWETKKKQTPSVSTGVIDELNKRVLRAGALGGKVAGAGGGGYFMVFAPDKESEVCEAISSLNLKPEPVFMDWLGIEVWK